MADIYEPLSFDVDKLTDKALRDIYNENYIGVFNEDLWKITTGQLNKAVDEIYNNITDADKLWVNKVKFQNSMFSAFKSNNQTTSLNHIKIASKAKNFSEFKKEALSITNDYNKNWLKVEYKAAKAKLRSAKNFNQALKDSDLYPNIKYLPSVAQDPREEHKKYYNIIRPISDPIWNTILPPSTWGCQCQWKTTDEGVTDVPGKLPLPSPGMDSNTAKTGLIFTNNHPYFNVDEQTALAIAKQNIATIHNTSVDNFTFFLKHAKTNGCVYSFDKLGSNEKTQNIRIGKIFASKGNEVQLFDNYSIDSRVNGIFNEFKTFNAISFNSIDKAFQKANNQFLVRKLQGDITLEFNEFPNKELLLKALNSRINRINDKMQIYNVHFIINKKYMGYSTINEIREGTLPF